MKLLITLCAFVGFVSALERAIFKIPPESLAKLHKFAIPCAEKYNIDSSILRIIGEPTLPRDEATNNFLYCYSLSSGIIKEDGHLVVGRLVGVLGEHPRREALREALTKCNDITKENPVATTVAMHMCYSDTSPVLFEY